MTLAQVSSLTLTPRAPFAFDATFHKPDHFASQDNEWQPGVRWQTWQWRGQCLGLKFASAGTVDKPSVTVMIYANQPVKDIDALEAEIRYRYNMDLDLTDFYQKFAYDDLLGPIITRWRGMRPGHAGSLYDYLIIGVMLQNTTVKRSVQMLQALFERCGTQVEFDGKTLWCFWQPGALQNVSEEDLRAIKLGYRAKTIKRLDEYFAATGVDEQALRVHDMVEQKDALLAIYGVGPATVWYLLFDIFHRYDFFDHISPWEQKIYSKLFFDRDPDTPVSVEELKKRFALYAPYQQLAVHYIWEDLWWQRVNQPVPWLEELIRL